MNKLYQISIALLLMVAACKQGEQGMVGPQGATGADGKNGTSSTEKGPVGDKGATGDKGTTGDKGAVGATIASNVTVTNWQILSWSFTDIVARSTYKEANYLGKVTVDALTKEAIKSAVILTYIRYTNDKNTVVTALVDGDNIYDLKNYSISELFYYGVREKEVLFASQDYLFAGDNEKATIDGYLKALNNEKLETRTFIIQNKTGGRLAAIDSKDYAKVCQTLNINP